MDEFVALFRSATQEPQLFAQRFGRGLADACTLYTLEDQSSERIGLVWQGIDAPPAAKRDVCLLEVCTRLSSPYLI